MRVERGYESQEKGRSATIHGLIHSSRQINSRHINVWRHESLCFSIGYARLTSVRTSNIFFPSRMDKVGHQIFFSSVEYSPCTHTWSKTYAHVSLARINRMILFFFSFCIAWYRIRGNMWRGLTITLRIRLGVCTWALFRVPILPALLLNTDRMYNATRKRHSLLLWKLQESLGTVGSVSVK